jgi:hypothetical protein
MPGVSVVRLHACDPFLAAPCRVAEAGQPPLAPVSASVASKGSVAPRPRVASLIPDHLG